jgi:hypothetical protein
MDIFDQHILHEDIEKFLDLKEEEFKGFDYDTRQCCFKN